MIPKLVFSIIMISVLTPALVYAAPGTMSVDVDGDSFDVSYDATGLNVISIEPDLDFISLILEVEVTESSGVLEITLDRSFFDSIYEGVDEPYIIIAEGEEPDFEEITTDSQSRVLRIELPAGTEELEIIGTDFNSGPSVETTVEEPEPVVEEPEPVVEEPEPVVEEPEPVVEEPEPVVEEPETTTTAQCGPGTVLQDGECVLEKSCGPGTILQDGVCVLDERCGPGTVYEDGVCVVASSGSSTGLSTGNPGSFKELGVGLFAAIGVAFAVMIILWIISRGSRQKP